MKRTLFLTIFLWSVSSAQVMVPRYVMDEPFACQDAAGNTLSEHSRLGTAQSACGERKAASPEDAFTVFGGQFRVELVPIAAAQSYPAGNNSRPAALPPNNAPVWNRTPSPGAVEGVPQSLTFLTSCGDPDGDSLTFALNIGSASLPTGVSIVGTDLVDDGTGTPGTTTGIIVDCDDGTVATASESFSYTITAAGGFSANSPSYTPVIAGAAGPAQDRADWPSGSIDIYRVTSTSNGSAAGTIRDALTSSWTGCRGVIGEISGTVSFAADTQMTLGGNCLILAGESFPSPGLLLAGVELKVTGDFFYFGHFILANKVPGGSTDETDGFSVRATSTDQPSYVIVRNVDTWFNNDGGWDITGSTSSNRPTKVEFIQSNSSWHLNDPFNIGNNDSRGSLISFADDVFYNRVILAHNRSRNPLLRDTSGSMIDSVVYNHGTQAVATNDNDLSSEWNFEGNIIVTGSSQVNNEGIRIKGSSVNTEIFWDKVGAGANMGLGGMPDPPNENITTNVLETSRITTSFPAGAVVTANCAANDTSCKQALATLVSDCNGSRPNDRIALQDTLHSHIKSYGTLGTVIDDPSDVGGIPTLAENTTTHTGVPTTVSGFMDWVNGLSDDLMPAGLGCL